MKKLNLLSTRIKITFLLFLAISIVLISQSCVKPAYAAPYGKTNVTTIYDRLYESDLVIYGKIIQKLRYKKGKKWGRTEIEVYEKIKGEDWKKGDFFYINSILKQDNKSVGIFCLYKQYKGGGAFYQFNTFYTDKNKQIYDYAKQLYEFMEKDDNVGRVRYLFSEVNSKNKTIASDAFLQLGLAPYQDLRKAADDINSQSLRWLIVSKDVKPERKSFYCFLYGLKSDPEDPELIKRIINNKKNLKSPILYGAMMAYGLLFDDHPMFFYKKAKGQNSQVMKLAILEAVFNLMKYERPQNPKDLLSCYYQLLYHGDKKVVLKALKIAQQLKLSGPIKYMKYLYTDRFKNSADVKIAIITYLKLVRRAPGAMKLLYQFKSIEKDPKVKKYFMM